MNTHALIRGAVRAIIDQPFDREWSIQGFGMLRLYLTPEIRLHIWNHHLAVPDVSTIHDHPWDFRSYIVSGIIRQFRYRETPNESGGRRLRRQLIRCGPGGCATGEPVVVELFRGAEETFKAGEWYEQQAEEIHESIPEDGTVTMVERHFRSDTEHARVYFEGERWVSAEPRKATTEEIAFFCQSALRRWNG